MKHKNLYVLLVVFWLSISALAGGPAYHIVKTYQLGGEGGWDYLTLDGASRHLYIARETHVVVIDADTGKRLGDIPNTPGVHGIALAPEFGRGFISNGGEGTVTIFDLRTLKLIRKVKAGENPDAILYDPFTKRVFTFNGGSHDSTAIDAASGKVAGAIKLGGKPEFGVSDGNGKLFVNLEDKSELAVIDPAKLKVIETWPLGSQCESPTGLAIDRRHRRLFAGCRSKVMTVIDADSGKVIATLPIGRGVDATRFDPETGLAFASCGEGVLTVVREDSPDQFRVIENVATQPGARTMELDEKTHEIFLVTAKFGPAPTPTKDRLHSRPAIMPDSFVVLVLAP